MFKYLKPLLLLVTVFSLTACQLQEESSKTTTASSKVAMKTARLIVTADGNKTDETITFKDGQTVMDVLKANYDVKEKDGFITAIDGLEQNPDKKIYWMFKINKEVAPKAANQIKVKANDTIEFYQEIYK